jgi:hypothetical protein
MAARVSAPRGREIDLVIEDGPNAPLGVNAVTAILSPQPWIYFESRDGGPLAARYGHARLERPVYDLEARRKSIAVSRPPRAKWGGAPAESRVAGAADVSIPPGAVVERKDFRTARELAPHEPGLAVLLLDGHVLAHGPGLDDVRIVDLQGRQIAWLLERRDEPLVIGLQRPRRVARETLSIYSVSLPYESLPPGSRIVLRTEPRVFRREVSLRIPADERRGTEAVEVARASWSTAEAEVPPPALVLDLPAGRLAGLEIVIDEGDNAPLPLRAPELLLPSRALRFASPGGSLTLLYGNAAARAPRYDIELLAARLRAEPARELSFRSAAPPVTDSPPSRDRKIFWIAIAVVVVALLVILVKVLRGLA